MRLSIIGSGNVGATAALLAAQKNLGDVVLVDVIEGVPQGKGLDILQSCPVEGSSVSVLGTNRYEDTRDSDIVVITAGLARKPGMTREDLLRQNAAIVNDIVQKVMSYSKNPILIIVTNPLDIMTYHAWRISGLPKSSVVGQAGVLDGARFRSFIATSLGISPCDVATVVLGGHGDTMVPLVRFTTVSGVPLTDLLPPTEIDALVERTRNGGGEIVNLLKTGSAYYAPASASIQMVEAIVRDQKRMMPCSALVQGEYGLNDVFIGVPVVLGRRGIERIIELKLNHEELQALKASAEVYKNGIKMLYPND